MRISHDYIRQRQSAASISKMAISGLIRCYQAIIAPLFPPSCRFYPSCSEYTREAVLKHGAIKGSWMGIKRIIRCNPFHDGGHDPVP